MSYQKARDISRKGAPPEGYEDDVIRPFKALLLQNIARSLQLFYSSSQSSPIDRLFLTGGVSALKDLAAEVERVLHVPTEVANPLSKLQISPSVNQSSLIDDAPAMMLAIGLALGGLD
jgi:type IV pilus assembly protein PilM